MSEAVVQVADLTKQFDGVQAVDGISFDVSAGETVALLGANGAGKTSTLAMLLGLLLPTAGTIRVLGIDVVRERERALARVNFSSPYVELPRRLTVMQNLHVFAKLYGVARPRERARAIAADLDLEALLRRRVGSLSSGQKTRVALAKALINAPDVLFLDEPTASLDPDTGDWVRGYLEAYQHRTGCAILLASHNMGEVERLCHRVLMMRKGRIVDEGTPQALITRYGRATMEEVFLDVARGRGHDGTTEAAQ
ncbi:ABC transporter ATP-binding protein [Ferruginivarius sediminum]|uniref:ABC transporter ATP-binding protein n=1 Tax=Ferruginivarius sediminum TaxID=2661937 RepID=A0A369TD24_9PROT|nr:ABC transporter ATP-binding protein [Ferruginivarius sediminum]RDD63188.1 ABC transporter ATP-binding protein [Ferruginivarius sediminum]